MKARAVILDGVSGGSVTSYTRPAAYVRAFLIYIPAAARFTGLGLVR